MRKLFIILISSFDGVISSQAPIQAHLANESPKQRCTHEMSAAGFDISSAPTEDPERKGLFKYQFGEIFRSAMNENRFDECLAAWCEITMKLVKLFEKGANNVPAWNWGGLKWPPLIYGRQWQIYHLLEAASARLTGGQIQPNALAEDMYPPERQRIWDRINVDDQCPGEVLTKLVRDDLHLVNI